MSEQKSLWESVVESPKEYGQPPMRSAVAPVESGSSPTPELHYESRVAEYAELIEKALHGTMPTPPHLDEIEDEDYLHAIATMAAASYSGEDTRVSGNYARAEGQLTLASGNYSHAEGRHAKATGYASHAEGNFTLASGGESHAEGSDTIASGQFAHAEGVRTTARGNGSHTEGLDNYADNAGSHAEGQFTWAYGVNSHAAGEGTHAKRRAQFTFGQYNVQDSGSYFERGTYIEIVGNGTDDDHRSNARTLDWSGNEALAGGLTLGKGTADETTITAAQLKALLAML